LITLLIEMHPEIDYAVFGSGIEEAFPRSMSIGIFNRKLAS
jgi:hypothetical protein